MSGGVRVAAIYARNLIARGHEVFVFAPPNKIPTFKDQIRSMRKGNGLIFQRRRSHSHFDDLGVPYQLLDKFRPVKESDLPDADIIIATWWETAEWILPLSAAKGKKVYLIQGYEMFDFFPKDRVAATYRSPTKKITVAQWIADILRQEYGDNSVTVVPNAVDLTQFNAPPRAKRAAPKVGFIYSRTSIKGCDIIFNAIEIAARSVPDLQVLVFSTEKLPVEQPLPKNLEYHYMPAKDKLNGYYADCDAWLFGSRSEGFGLPILEAMACRTPVIGVPAAAAPDLLRDGSGILLKTHDPEEMASAIVHVCHMTEGDWLALSEKAYRKAAGYTWDDATTILETALKAEHAGTGAR
jgi:glycosyltransferase involved in cell wall biosynthesis